MASADSERLVWWYVALETTLFFSPATWLLVQEVAWPTAYPLRFVLEICLGAFLALLLCHVLPARAAELDSFDVVEGLAIQGHGEIDVLNGISLHGGWPGVFRLFSRSCRRSGDLGLLTLGP